MERQTRSHSSPNRLLSRAVARGKRHPHLVTLARLLVVVLLIGSTAAWRGASHVAAASGSAVLIAATSVSGT
ncbi:MAG: hypothetical protein ACRDG4_20350, partial [Chloroflexota bacterium]